MIIMYQALRLCCIWDLAVGEVYISMQKRGVQVPFVLHDAEQTVLSWLGHAVGSA